MLLLRPASLAALEASALMLGLPPALPLPPTLRVDSMSLLMHVVCAILIYHMSNQISIDILKSLLLEMAAHNNILLSTVHRGCGCHLP